MDLSTAAAVFAVVFLAELPDKSLFASLVLGTRYPARWIWLGASTAFVLHVVIAVALGQLLTLAPRRVVEAVVAVLFLVGAVVLLKPEPAEDLDEEVPDPPAPAFWPVAATSFGVVFVGEWGDITQLTTANFAARYDDPVSVGVGAALALITAAGLAAHAGAAVLRLVPLALVRRVAGLLLLAFSVAAFVTLLR